MANAGQAFGKGQATRNTAAAFKSIVTYMRNALLKYQLHRRIGIPGSCRMNHTIFDDISVIPHSAGAGNGQSTTLDIDAPCQIFAALAGRDCAVIPRKSVSIHQSLLRKRLIRGRFFRRRCLRLGRRSCFLRRSGRLSGGNRCWLGRLSRGNLCRLLLRLGLLRRCPRRQIGNQSQ